MSAVLPVEGNQWARGESVANLPGQTNTFEGNYWARGESMMGLMPDGLVRGTATVATAAVAIAASGSETITGTASLVLGTSWTQDGWMQPGWTQMGPPIAIAGTGSATPADTGVGYAFPQRAPDVDWDALLRPDPLIAPDYQMRSAVAFGWAATARLSYNDDEIVLALLTGDAHDAQA